MELSGSNIKKFLIFSQKKAFLIFRKSETLQNSLYFRKRNLFIFQEASYISGTNFPSSKSKRNPLKSFFIFRGYGTF